jgi:hypothetical protein
MDILKIKPTNDTPAITLDPENNIFEISGKSYPEDTKDFYSPVLKWIEEYANECKTETSISFKLTYFNSSSYKPILDILNKLKEVKNHQCNFKVQWHYKEGDLDMKEAGEEFSELVEVPFTFHSF